MAKILLLLSLAVLLLSHAYGDTSSSGDENSLANKPSSSLDWWQWDPSSTKDTDNGDSVEKDSNESDPLQNLDHSLDDKGEDNEDNGARLIELDDDEVVLYMNLEDRIFLAQVDEHIVIKSLEANHAIYSKDHGRRKRIAPLIGRAAIAAGRALFRQFSRNGVTRSGSRLTRHYSRPGNYGDATRDFQRLSPNNVRPFNNGRISGQTGTVGNHRVTVRDGSSSGRPTLEIRSHGGNVVRKFRYN